MRAHASEGLLFRTVVEQALARQRLAHGVLLEKRALADAARALGKSEAEIGRALAAMGKQAGRPWRAYEKLAAIAAWMALAG